MTAWEAVLVGFGLGLSLAAPPGPVLAKVAYETAARRWVTGLLVGVGATTADLVFFLLVWLGLLRNIPTPRVLALLAFAGVVVMEYFAYGAWRSAGRPLAPGGRRISGFLGGFVLAATSPFNWAWWITAGASYVGQYGATLAWGFFSAILLWVCLSVALFAYGQAKIQRFETYVSYASAVLLWGFGALLAYNGIRWLAG